MTTYLRHITQYAQKDENGKSPFMTFRVGVACFIFSYESNLQHFTLLYQELHLEIISTALFHHQRVT